MSPWWCRKYRNEQCEATQAPKSPKVMLKNHFRKLHMGRTGRRHMSN